MGGRGRLGTDLRILSGLRLYLQEQDAERQVMTNRNVMLTHKSQISSADYAARRTIVLELVLVLENALDASAADRPKKYRSHRMTVRPATFEYEDDDEHDDVVAAAPRCGIWAKWGHARKT
jgi:hypothetical protein